MRRSLRFLLLISVLPRCLSAQALAQRVGAVEERTGDASVAGDPLLPSVLADSVTIWPSLLRLARTPTVSKGPRAIDLFEEILR